MGGRLIPGTPNRAGRPLIDLDRLKGSKWIALFLGLPASLAFHFEEAANQDLPDSPLACFA